MEQSRKCARCKREVGISAFRKGYESCTACQNKIKDKRRKLLYDADSVIKDFVGTDECDELQDLIMAKITKQPLSLRELAKRLKVDSTIYYNLLLALEELEIVGEITIDTSNALITKYSKGQKLDKPFEHKVDLVTGYRSFSI